MIKAVIFFTFDYPLGLHHTQTFDMQLTQLVSFDYPLGLHHTQTAGHLNAA